MPTDLPWKKVNAVGTLCYRKAEGKVYKLDVHEHRWAEKLVVTDPMAIVLHHRSTATYWAVVDKCTRIVGELKQSITCLKMVEL